MRSPFLLDPAFLRRLENLALRSRRIVRSGMQGERRSATLGRGVEFADYRGYQAGDDYRYIDWNIYSRLDRLFVKLFSAEEDINVHLLVDRSRSMGFPAGEGEGTKLHYAAQVAAAIGYIGLINLDRVSAAAFDRQVGAVYGPGRGRAQARPFFRFLAELTPEGTSDLAAVMREYAHRTRRRGLLVIVSDLLMAEGVEEGLRLARGHRFEPFVVHVVSEEDLTPPVAGDLRLIDSETGTAVEVSVDGAALRTFIRTRDIYLSGLERFCLRHGVEYLRATTAIPVADLVLRYLRVGGLIA